MTPVAAARVESGDRLLVPGDIHFDRHDHAALDVMLVAANSVGVNSVCLVGDTFESAGVSRHAGMRSARKFVRGATIKAEEAAARPWIRELSQLARPGKRHVLTGNHEVWWSGLHDEYPGLADTEWFEMYGDLFNGWHVHREYVSLRYGSLLVCHGHRLRGALSKNSAAAVLGNYPGQNTLYGHTHRIDRATTPSFKYGRQSPHGAWTIGHLKDRAAEFVDPFTGPHSERHQQGFAVVTFFDVGESQLNFNVELVTIQRDVRDRPYAVVNGEIYR